MSYEGAFGEFASHFRHGIPNPKLADRRKLLESNPELRLRINFAPLRAIIDFIEFKCVHGSSIARDEAIRGSDIDCGLVILQQPEPIDRQMAFIEELRRQGFSVYHPTEADVARAAYERALSQGIRYGTSEYEALSRDKTERDLQRVTFMTEEELQATDAFTNPGRVYLYGYTIPEHPA